MSVRNLSYGAVTQIVRVYLQDLLQELGYQLQEVLCSLGVFRHLEVLKVR